ncbi:MAG: flagellar biosynthetic protein FliP [Actinobacteria bacterium]|nr:flagellar biosynthetic protein FliP [Actinomycetota bacterium]NBR66741.1 flagellar biosynthetic protein FliP [Actinomycetota bacterium]
MIRKLRPLAAMICCIAAPMAMGQDAAAIELLRTAPVAGGGQAYSLTLQALGLMTLLTLLPAIVLSMTAFTRIVIVLGLLRQALGAAQTPPNQVIVGLSLFLTFFVMGPTLNEVQRDALQPYVAESIPFETALQRAVVPMKKFMLAQTRESDLKLFMDLAKTPPVKAPLDTPLSVLLPSFLTSELRTAFTIGFLIYIPFLVIDLVVASVLMSMGMMMVSPVMIALPFKFLLFVLVDGWALILGSLAASFAAPLP